MILQSLKNGNDPYLNRVTSVDNYGRSRTYALESSYILYLHLRSWIKIPILANMLYDLAAWSKLGDLNDSIKQWIATPLGFSLVDMQTSFGFNEHLDQDDFIEILDNWIKPKPGISEGNYPWLKNGMSFEYNWWKTIDVIYKKLFHWKKNKNVETELREIFATELMAAGSIKDRKGYQTKK